METITIPKHLFNDIKAMLDFAVKEDNYEDIDFTNSIVDLCNDLKFQVDYINVNKK